MATSEQAHPNVVSPRVPYRRRPGNPDCDPNSPDVVSPRVPYVVIGTVGLALAVFALFKLLDLDSARDAPPRPD